MFEEEGIVYQGTWFYALDSKGRIIMPAPFRQRMGTVVVLTRGIEYEKPCILAWDVDTWKDLTHRKAGDRLFHHFYLSSARPQKVDPESGRVLLPWELREYSKIQLRENPVDLAVTGIGPAVRIIHKHELQAEIDALAGTTPSLTTGTLYPGVLPSRPTMPALSEKAKTNEQLLTANNGAVLVAAPEEAQRPPRAGRSRAA